MRIKVIPNAKHNDIIKKNNILHIYTTASAEKNKANKKIIQLLSAKFKIPKSHIRISQGQKCRYKTIEIDSQTD